jgi:hypothetical protein
MDMNDQIINQLRKQAESAFARQPCSECHAAGRWKLDGVIEGVSFISNTRTAPGKKDVAQRVFLVYMECFCGHVQKTDVALLS